MKQSISLGYAPRNAIRENVSLSESRLLAKRFKQELYNRFPEIVKSKTAYIRLSIDILNPSGPVYDLLLTWRKQDEHLVNEVIKQFPTSWIN